MIKKLVAGLLILVAWASTGLAAPTSTCACGESDREQERLQIPGISDAARMEATRLSYQYVKGVADAQISMQQVRNAFLQERLYMAQIQQANAATRREKVIMWLAISGAVFTGGKILYDEWREQCSEVVDRDQTILVCPF